MSDLKSYIRDIPDFPKEGIVFKDITPLLKNGSKFRQAVDLMADEFSASARGAKGGSASGGKNKNIDVVVSVESRGFIFGATLAYKFGVGLVPIRKRGKLPYKTHSITYDLEYGKDTLEIHQDAVKKGDRVLIVDDLLATGGTTRAVIDLVEKLGGEIAGIAFLIELTALKGREKLKDYPVISLIKDKYC